MFDVKQKKAYLFLLGLIIIISIFFRTYQIVERFGFDHDNDLSSWIVKDKKVGHIGVIAPKIIPSEKDIEESCRQENTNLTDPMLGYVD